MSIIAEAEELAFKLSEAERGQLVERLISTLPSPFTKEDDDWVEEALRRDREMDEKPETAMTQEEFFASLRDHVRR